MAKVESGELESHQVISICNLSKEAEKLLRGERERTKLLMKMDEHERNFGKRPQYRELASFAFADTTYDPRTGNPRLDADSIINRR